MPLTRKHLKKDTVLKYLPKMKTKMNLKTLFRILAALILPAVLLALCASCKQTAQPPVSPGSDPAASDFSFSITWGCYGVSSYDSETGKLIKTTDAADVEKYTCYVKLSDEELSLVRRYLCSDIDLKDYPAAYDPFNAPGAKTKLMSEPSQTITVSVTVGGETESVSCKNIAFGSVRDCFSKEAEALWQAVTQTIDLITSLPEWEAFPEYERFYE